MDTLIKEPLKRFLANSKEYAKRHLADNINSVTYYANSEEAVINMMDIKSLSTKTCSENYATTNNMDSFNYSNNNEDKSIALNNLRNNQFNSKVFEDKILDNDIRIVKTKLLDSPQKSVVKYLNKSDPSHRPEQNKIEIINQLNQSIPAESSKKCPVIKIKLTIKKENQDKKKTENTNKEENDLNNSSSNNKSPDDDKQIITDLKDSCIFDENKLRPLSPILNISSSHFQRIEDLIDYHECQVRKIKGRRTSSSKTLPRMGTNALMNRSLEIKQGLTDPEIISAMVRDRFVVNMFESRHSRRSTMKRRRPSTYGRIYKSLERAVITPNKNKDIISMQHSSPITFNDQYVSLSPKHDISNKNKNINSMKHSSPTTINEQNVSLSPKHEVSSKNKHFVDNVKNIVTSPEASNSEQFITINENTSNNTNLKETMYLTTEENNGNTFYKSEDKIVVNQTNLNENSVDVIPPDNSTNKSDYSEIKLNQNNDLETEILLENNTANEFSSYNMEDFLKKALGEELNKYENDSQLEVTAEVVSEEEEPKQEEMKQLLHEESMCTSDASDLVSKINTFQSNFYRSLTKKIQRMTDTLRLPSAPKYAEIESVPDLNLILPNNERITELVRQAAIQFESMKQITKALDLCRNTKEFLNSSEQVEGERLLLVASYKRQVILDEIRRLDYDLKENISSTEDGTLLISNIIFPLKEESTEQTIRRDHFKWYVCIFSYGPRVYATQPTLARVDGKVHFGEEVIFTDLPSDFSINIEIYCLIQRRADRIFSHESKFHINKNSKKGHCPSPKKFFPKEKTMQKIPTRFDTGIRTSSFKLCGNLKLRVSDLSKSGPWYMRKVPLCSSLNGSVSMVLKSFVEIPTKYSGFLNIGLEVRDSIIWNRRWCVLDGYKFRYWNYPCEEDSCDFLNELNLKKCTNAQIEIADRTFCARPRTLFMEIDHQDFSSKYVKSDLKKYFLSADNATELNNWKTQLNTVISALSIWNVGYLRKVD